MYYHQFLSTILTVIFIAQLQGSTEVRGDSEGIATLVSRPKSLSLPDYRQFKHDRLLQTGSTIRINAGGANWTDPATGRTWASDVYYNGPSSTYSACPNDIIDTNLDTIFCSHRSFWGTPNTTAGYYEIPVTSGYYTVNLLFAEVYHNEENKRIFQVLINGNLVDSSLDVVQEAGGSNTALILTRHVTALSPNNKIQIQFVNYVENSMISGIEILPAPQFTPAPLATPPSQTSPAIRINAGSNSNWTDPATGYVWLSDRYSVGGWQYSGCPKDIEGTDQDGLYCTQRTYCCGTGVGYYKIPVSPGQYTVRLLLAEIYFGDENQRVFNVSVQGVLIAPALDLNAAVGPNTQYILTTVTTVPTGTKNIEIAFSNVKDGAVINAIEVLPGVVTLAPVPVAPPTPPSLSPAIRINTGSSSNWTDPATGYVWLSDEYSVGGWKFNSCPTAIEGTDQDGLLCNHHTFCCGTATGYYRIPVSPGQYTVRLLFAETYFDQPSKRIYNVSVQGAPLVSNFDLISVVGFKTAYELTTVAMVPSGSKNVEIAFKNIVDGAIISGIEVLPGVVTPSPTFAPTSPPQVPVAPAAPTPPVIPAIRINAGSAKNYTDPITGNKWMADKYFNGGWTYDQCPRSIDNTDLDGLFCSQRTFQTNGQYNIPIATPGLYTVKLSFAELFWWETNQRTFKLTVQGNVVSPSVDIMAAAQASNTAYTIVKVLTIDSITPFITIDIETIKDNAVLNAIEILPGIVTPAPTGAPVPAPFTGIRINAGGPKWTDPVTGLVWMADKYSENGGGIGACPNDIAETDQDDLLCSYRVFDGPFGYIGRYTIPIPKGLYTVRLLFAEMFWTGLKDRMFEVRVQGTTVNPALDLVEVAGTKVAYVLTTVAPVTPLEAVNSLKVEFVNILNHAIINAIEILPYVPPPVSGPVTTTYPGLRINSGFDQPYVDVIGQTWAPDQDYIGGSTWSKIVPNIGGTEDDTLYFYERAGDDFTYNITVPAGLYQVTLYFTETLFTQTGQRVFDIHVGDSIRSNYDILSVVPPSTSTFVVIYGQSSNDGVLTIRFVKSAGFPTSAPAKINALQILLDTPHLAHSVARGPYQGTVSDASNTTNVVLDGGGSHTHDPTAVIIDAVWKEGTTVIGDTLELNHKFSVGNHTISLTVTDTNNHQSIEATTVYIRPLGFPTITQVTPATGDIAGNFQVTIIGAGFTYPASSTTVTFGQTNLTGSAIQIVDSTTIKVTCPPTVIAQRVTITITTPKGISEEGFFDYIGTIPIVWTTGTLVSYAKPSVGRFGPDRKLYVGTDEGSILKITLNSDFTQVVGTTVSTGHCPTGPILGVAFDPMDTKTIPDVYYTCNVFFHGWPQSTSGPAIGGKLMMASGPNLETRTTIISGLPVSDHDHGLNAIHFGDNGELYMAMGSNTNGGLPGALSHTKELKENFFSAAINVAYLSHPDFNGTITYTASDDGNPIAKGFDVFGAGLRNPFGLIFHSNGKVYASENGPNLGYGPFSTGCGNNDQIPEFNGLDEIMHVEKGKYYGHPNRKRAAYLNDTRQCVWYPGDAKADGNVSPALVTGWASRVGLMEYHSNHFGGQLRRNIFSVQFGGQIFRLILNDDGTNVVIQSSKFIPLDIGTDSLDATQAPNGNVIDIRYGGNGIDYYKPAEAATTLLIAKTCFPTRGPTAGGNLLSVYGVNFGTVLTDITVKVGTGTCTVQSVTNTQIDCILPGGAVGAVDVVVTKISTGAASTFDQGYRYITGLPKPGFVLPVYIGV